MSLALLGSEQFTRQVDRTEFYFFPVLVAMLSSFGTIKLNLSCVHMGAHANFKKKYCLGFFFSVLWVLIGLMVVLKKCMHSNLKVKHLLKLELSLFKETQIETSFLNFNYIV